MFRLAVAFCLLINVSVCLADEAIRVRTLKNLKEIEVVGFGIRFSQFDTTNLESILPVKKHFKIFYKNEEWSVYRDGLATKSVDKNLELEGDLVQINGESVSDRIELHSTGNKFELIAKMPLDEYLKGVVPSEMPIKWPLEALKAQVISARSYALSMMASNINKPYDLDDTTLHQVFQMKNFNSASQAQKEKVDFAIRDTKGFYLTSQNGSPYLSYYHSDCGGSTEEPINVWGLKRKNGTVKDEACRLNRSGLWEHTIPVIEIINFIKKKNHMLKEIQLTDVQVASRSESGRVKEIELHYVTNSSVGFEAAESKTLKITGEDIRKHFGYTKVKSTLFDFKLENDNLVFKGRGQGHGVGMCQNGARFMALAGATYSQIIKRYYPKAKLERTTTLIGQVQ